MRVKGQDFGALVLLAALWGGSFLFIRVTAPALGPLLVADARVVIAGGALLLYAAALRRLPSWRTYWRRFLIMGLLNNAVPFTLIGTAELHLTASLAAIFERHHAALRHRRRRAVAAGPLDSQKDSGHRCRIGHHPGQHCASNGTAPARQHCHVPVRSCRSGGVAAT